MCGVAVLFGRVREQIKSLVAGVASVQPRTADKVRELQDKARSLQQRAVKLLADRRCACCGHGGAPPGWPAPPGGSWGARTPSLLPSSVALFILRSRVRAAAAPAPSPRSDLVKKGSSGNEATKKLQPALQSLQEARTEFAAAVQAVFAPY